jgi:hypothetical protein
LGIRNVILAFAVLTTLLGAWTVWWFAKARGPFPTATKEADQEAGTER